MTRTLPSRQPDAGGRLRAYRAHPIWGERSEGWIRSRGWNKGDPTTFMESGMFMDDNAFFFPPLSMLGIIYFHIIVSQNARDDKTRRIFLANLNYI